MATGRVAAALKALLLAYGGLRVRALGIPSVLFFATFWTT
jgi:hypothetical protein